MLVRAVFLVLSLMVSQVSFAEPDFDQLDKCLNAAIEIGKGYLVREHGLNPAQQGLEFDAPGQTFSANGGLVYCISVVDSKTKNLLTKDVLLDPYDCREVVAMDRKHPDSACRELDELNNKTSPSKNSDDQI